jgi:hypothetical protein
MPIVLSVTRTNRPGLAFRLSTTLDATPFTVSTNRYNPNVLIAVLALRILPMQSPLQLTLAYIPA